MKKLIVISLSLILSLVACGEKASSSQESAADTNPHAGHGATGSEIIDLMHAPMMAQAFQKSKNPDVDFIYNMIPHHQGAIDSSKKLLETTTNEQLIALANAIISEQEKEISEFNALLPQLQSTNTDYSDVDVVVFGDKAEELMNKMMADMSSIVASGNDDIDFLAGMIPHHQGAIDASKQILTVTKDEKIKEIANRIIMAQESEIATMNALLSTLKASVDPHAGH